MLQLSSISKSYGDNLLFEDVSFIVNPGDRLGLVGPNGCGKTTLLRIIVGEEPPDAGSVRFNPPDLRPGYLGQSLACAPEETVAGYLGVASEGLAAAEARVAEAAMGLAAAGEAEREELVAAYDGALAELECVAEREQRTREAAALLAGLGLRGLALETKVAVLSGGQKTRLGLARLVATGCNLLLLDEPINHLDIPSRASFERAIAAFGGTVLAAAHDRYFIRQFATRIWHVSEGRVASYLELEDLPRR